MPIAVRNDLSADQVRALLDYDAETGELRWKRTEARSKHWNSRFAGKLAGHLNKNGVVSIRIGDVLYLAHRIIWLIMTGEWPEAEIDHRDGDHSNNRWANLREANRTENMLNRAKQRNNASGFLGVRFRPHHGKWEARININGKQVWHIYASSAEEASEARREALPRFHGEFVRD